MKAYYVSTEHNIKWLLLNATTLLGAKREVTRYYQMCKDGKIEIAVKTLAKLKKSGKIST